MSHLKRHFVPPKLNYGITVFLQYDLVNLNLSFTLTLSLAYRNEYSLNNGDLHNKDEKMRIQNNKEQKCHDQKKLKIMRSFLFSHSWPSSNNSCQSRSCKEM